jgi:hypothetical protein
MCTWPCPESSSSCGLGIARVADGRVLFLQAVHRGADLVLVAAALRLDGVGDQRLGERDRRDADLGGRIGQQIVRVRILQFGHGAEIAGAELGDVCLRLALQREQMAQRSLAVARVVVDRGVRLQGAADDAQHRDAARERIGDRLPHERGGGAGVVGRHARRVAVGVNRGEPRSAGDGTSVTMASSSGCAPMALRPETHTSGKSLPAAVAARSPAVNCSCVSVPLAKNASINCSSASATISISAVRACAARSAMAAGISPW